MRCRIPLSYVRDVTYNQNFIQAMFDVSDITVSAPNGDKVVLNNLRNGEATREIIWKLVTYLQSLPVPKSVPTQSW